jgi:hypothetical protein
LDFRLVRDQYGRGAILGEGGNAFLTFLDSQEAANRIRRSAHAQGVALRTRDVNEVVEILQSHADANAPTVRAYYRVAPIENGIELDLGDEAQTRVRITPGQVQVLETGSQAVFYRSSMTRPLVQPAEKGDLRRLDRYVNLHPIQRLLFIAWLSYTLAHPKVPGTSYVILVLLSMQGSGKSFLCKHIISALADPSRTGVQVFPLHPKDFMVAARNAHVLAYDNLRGIRPTMSDMLCVASTGGTFGTRKLYTDADQHVEELHVALVLNGIHPFVDQPDLAQRCLPLQMQPFDETGRRSEGALLDELATDMPAIFRGLLDLIAKVLVHLPSVEPEHPARMIDFVRWLSAMEKVYGAPPGAFQLEYERVLTQFQRDSLQEHALAEGVLAFVDSLAHDRWEGTPEDLLERLCDVVSPVARRSRDWPSNPIALSKRLRSLEGGFRSQGIGIEFSRGKHRRITLIKLGGMSHV